MRVLSLVQHRRELIFGKLNSYKLNLTRKGSHNNSFGDTTTVDEVETSKYNHKFLFKKSCFLLKKKLPCIKFYKLLFTMKKIITILKDFEFYLQSLRILLITNILPPPRRVHFANPNKFTFKISSKLLLIFSKNKRRI